MNRRMRSKVSNRCAGSFGEVHPKPKRQNWREEAARSLKIQLAGLSGVAIDRDDAVMPGVRDQQEVAGDRDPTWFEELAVATRDEQVVSLEIGEPHESPTWVDNTW